MYEIFEMLLAKNGVKTADVVKATGLSHSTFGDWKSGRSTPKPDKMKKIATYFNVPLEYMLTGEMPAFNKDLAEILPEFIYDKEWMAASQKYIDLSADRQRDIINYINMIYENEKGK